MPFKFCSFAFKTSSSFSPNIVKKWRVITNCTGVIKEATTATAPRITRSRKVVRDMVQGRGKIYYPAKIVVDRRNNESAGSFEHEEKRKWNVYEMTTHFSSIADGIHG